MSSDPVKRAGHEEEAQEHEGLTGEAAAQAIQASLQAPDVWSKLHPKEHILQLLAGGTRLDGRSFTAIRPTTIELANITTADSSAIVSIGPTTVLACCTLEVTTPLATLPHSGFLQVEFHFNPLSSPPSSSSSSSSSTASLFAYGRPTPIAASFSHHLQSLLTHHVFPLTALSIVPSSHCFILHLDLVPLSLTSSSSLYDAATLAAVTALASLTLPPMVISDDGEAMIGDGEGRRVDLRQWPVVTSFVLVGEKVLVDVEGEEEEWSEAVARVTVGEGGQVLDVWKAGGAGMDKSEIEGAVQQAKRRSADLIPRIKQALQVKPAP